MENLYAVLSTINTPSEPVRHFLGFLRGSFPAQLAQELGPDRPDGRVLVKAPDRLVDIFQPLFELPLVQVDRCLPGPWQRVIDITPAGLVIRFKRFVTATEFLERESPVQVHFAVGRGECQRLVEELQGFPAFVPLNHAAPP